MEFFEFTESIQRRASERIVCVGLRDALREVLNEAALEKAFGGWILYTDARNQDYLGVWGARKVTALRRMLKHEGIEVSLTRGRPEGLRLRVRTTHSR